jgi:two-component system, OmpR family, response regulator MprA
MHDNSTLAGGDVLVIDDDPTIIALVVEVLTEEGYAVRSASNGIEGLQSIAHAPPALLLLDIQMPGLSGIEVAKQARAANHNFPIVVITATPRLAQSLEHVDGLDYLAKPFELNQLIALVAQHVPPAGVTQR